jgi:hypothetical protein
LQAVRKEDCTLKKHPIVIIDAQSSTTKSANVIYYMSYTHIFKTLLKFASEGKVASLREKPLGTNAARCVTIQNGKAATVIQ